ncbi:MAG: RagB/SusD family nutrient uptake outer membrane protein [Bacteroidales bacterium]
MKIYNKILCGLALITAGALTSCIGDLDVEPIDPNLNTPGNVFTSEEDYIKLLAKCYSGLSVSAPEGPNSDPDISGIDGGFGQYLRALYNLNELPTDEGVMAWVDQTVQDLHGLKWSTSDVFIGAMYSRLFYQISICNEFIRQARSSGYNSEQMQTWIAEARCLRALSYYHAIDMFGNVPFVTEDIEVGGIVLPKQISRAELYNWLVNEEIPGFIDLLKPARQNEKYRVDQGVAKMILAKLYLNAEVYAKVKAYDKCVDVCKDLINAGYTLENNFKALFGADNDRFWGSEIIFSVYQDGVNAQNYGGTTFMICAMTHGDWSDRVGASEGWGGIRVTPEFVDQFSDNDLRGNFYTEKHKKEINEVGTFTDGYAYMKYSNLKEDGSKGQHGVFMDCDFVVFRMADVYLMLAECAKRNAGNITEAEGLNYFNMIRKRVQVTPYNSYTLNDVLDERGRELAWECHRRSDLVRYNKLTSESKLWAWKGHVKEGRSVDSKYNLFPIPASDLNTNTNLVQNPGY